MSDRRDTQSNTNRWDTRPDTDRRDTRANTDRRDTRANTDRRDTRANTDRRDTRANADRRDTRANADRCTNSHPNYTDEHAFADEYAPADGHTCPPNSARFYLSPCRLAWNRL